MDLTIIADLLSSINPIVLGGAASGILVIGGVALYVKRNKNKFIENTDQLAQSNDFKTLKTEDLEREFGSLTVQTKVLDEDESLFFDKSVKNKITDNEVAQPSTKLVDEASVFDSFGKQEQAIESLKKAIEIETHEKEKVRLKILLSQYNNKKGKLSLDEIIKEYPSFHTKISFGAENTLSSLMGSVSPKLDAVQPTEKQNTKNFDIFDDLPVLSDSNKINISKEKSKETTQKTNIFDDLPSLEVVNTAPVLESDSTEIEKNHSLPLNSSSKKSNDIFNDLPSLDTLMEPVVQTKEEKPVEQIDQFSWTTSTAKPAIEDETEKMLKSLQEDADNVDKINENEAIDDMQKFWKEFGNMVVDIKKEVAENHKLIKEEPKEEPVIEVQTTPSVNKQPTTVADLPVLKEEIQVPLTPVTAPPVATPETAKVFKVWANWIVNIEGQQVFRNHFVNLKNPWGTSRAGEELYMGISKLSGKTPAGKAYPWVLVSVFPLNS